MNMTKLFTTTDTFQQLKDLSTNRFKKVKNETQSERDNQFSYWTGPEQR